ncbi:MAG: DUF3305 domain-containing protein [Kiloniellaceae bacterium]|nr:DUF3305 domain-containing protein [Kiloniellaceae bacterium]
MEKNESLPLGVVIEWRRVDHPWKDHDWRPVGVIPGAPALDPSGPWTLLREGDGWKQFHGGTLRLELFRSDTEGYKINLAQQPPRVFIVLRRSEDPSVDHEMLPYLVTANPYEAQNYVASGEEIVEGVAMPAEVIALVGDFFDAHHVEEAFTKRQRKNAKGRHEPFNRQPPVDQPRGKRPGVAGSED